MFGMYLNSTLVSIIEKISISKISNIKKINKGFYGYVYLIETNEKPYKYIAKVYKHEGYINYEEAQLNELRKHAITHVPEIIGKAYKKNNGVCDVLLMEFINGVNAGQIKITDEKEKSILSDEIIDNLLSIHEVSNPNGFGDFVSEQFSSSWEIHYKQQVDSIYEAIQKNKPLRLSSSSKQIADMLFVSYDKVFQVPVKENSLIHGDYNLWNLIVDPRNNHLIGMIDPMGCCYADKELELFQLENANGNQYDLLHNYSKRVSLSDNFELKKAYYRFWDDMKHLVNVGYCDNKLFKHYGQLALNLLKN